MLPKTQNFCTPPFLIYRPFVLDNFKHFSSKMSLQLSPEQYQKLIALHQSLHDNFKDMTIQFYKTYCTLTTKDSKPTTILMPLLEENPRLKQMELYIHDACESGLLFDHDISTNDNYISLLMIATDITRSYRSQILENSSKIAFVLVKLIYQNYKTKS